MLDFLREIKWAYQRVRYGYDERITWELDGYFNQFVKPIKEFCLEQTDYEDAQKDNPKRYEIFTKTLDLIDKFEKVD